MSDPGNSVPASEPRRPPVINFDSARQLIFWTGEGFHRELSHFADEQRAALAVAFCWGFRGDPESVLSYIRDPNLGGPRGTKRPRE